ncbi:MAG: hypothetical protein JST73_11780 [Actinobacteria bacterium]|nr:hypothetical protein [Actinomycetota bacterium]
MNERRRFRRSSPDAPQGIIPVLTVVAGLVAVVVATGLSLSGTNGRTAVARHGAAASGKGAAVAGGSTTAVPTTALIRGAGVTTLFVTTTTPITTTSSTTSTTIAGPEIASSTPSIVFASGQTTATFTVTGANPDGVDFSVTGVPPGMQASPTQGTVSQSQSVTITVRITDPTVAASGTIVLVGSDGSRVSIPVIVGSSSFSVTSVTLNPNPPVCGTPGRLTAVVTGSNVKSVVASVVTSAGTSQLSMSQTSGGAWRVALPDAAAGSLLSGTVTATDASGGVAMGNFSATVVSGPNCSG